MRDDATTRGRDDDATTGPPERRRSPPHPASPATRRTAFAWSVSATPTAPRGRASTRTACPAASFKPVSPPPYTNGGPGDFLSWVIARCCSERQLYALRQPRAASRWRPGSCAQRSAAIRGRLWLGGLAPPGAGAVTAASAQARHSGALSPAAGAGRARSRRGRRAKAGRGRGAQGSPPTSQSLRRQPPVPSVPPVVNSLLSFSSLLLFSSPLFASPLLPSPPSLSPTPP